SIHWPDINIVSPSDTVYYEILTRKYYVDGHVEDQIQYSREFLMSQNSVFTDNGGINLNIFCRGIPEIVPSACERFGLIFRVRSDSNVKWKDLEWLPIAVYNPDAEAISIGVP